MRIRADSTRCVGAGLCVLTVSSVFDQDVELGTVTLRTAQPPPEVESAVRQAVDICPSHAITIDEDD